MKSIVIINGHPNKKSFNYALSAAYLEGASSTRATISQINIADLTFNPSLEFGYSQR
ncbi:MAG: NAD(P)H dehydrogenase, partial [Flavobacteriaceae bacterium]